MRIYHIFISVLSLIFFIGQKLDAHKGKSLICTSVIDFCANCVVECINESDTAINESDTAINESYQSCIQQTCFNDTNDAQNETYRSFLQESCFQRASQLSGKSLTGMQLRRQESCDGCSNINKIWEMHELKHLTCMINECVSSAMLAVRRYMIGLKEDEIASYSKIIRSFDCIRCADKCYDKVGKKSKEVQLWRCFKTMCALCKSFGGPPSSGNGKLWSYDELYKFCRNCTRSCLQMNALIQCQIRTCYACVEKQVTLWNNVNFTNFRIFKKNTKQSCDAQCYSPFNVKPRSPEACFKRCDSICTKCYKDGSSWVCHEDNCQVCAAFEAAMCKNILTKRVDQRDPCFECLMHYPNKFEKLECLDICRPYCRGICTKFIKPKRCQAIIALCERCIATDFGLCNNFTNTTEDEDNEDGDGMNNKMEMVEASYTSNKTTICRKECYMKDMWICRTKNCMDCAMLGTIDCKTSPPAIGYHAKSVSKIEEKHIKTSCLSECDEELQDKHDKMACRGKCFEFCDKPIHRFFADVSICQRCIATYYDFCKNDRFIREF